MADPKPPGQVTYEAYEKRYAANFHNHKTAPWEKLPETQRDAWGVAAVALQHVIEEDMPDTTVHVEKDSDDTTEKRAWSLVCTKCGGKGRPAKGEGNYSGAKYCDDCSILFGWQSGVRDHG